MTCAMPFTSIMLSPLWIPPPSYGGGAPSHGAEGEGRTDDLRNSHDLKAAAARLVLSPSGPAGHLPRVTGKENEKCVDEASIDDPEFVRLLDRLVVVGLMRLRLVQVIALLVDLDDRPTLVPFHHCPAEGIAVGQAAIEGIATM